MLSPIDRTRLEKTATDNGFDLEGATDGAWLPFASSQTSLRIWLRVLEGTLYIVAFSRREVCAALPDLGAPWTKPLPAGACAARGLAVAASLHRLIRRAFQLSRALPDAPLQVFLQRTASLPRTTEAERLVVQRVGQDLFRNGLLDYWEGTCPVSGLVVAELLRASHIKPWAHCDTDAERLDVFNGLLLAPQLDAAFDRGFMTIDDAGRVIVSDRLDPASRQVLGLDRSLSVHRLIDPHRVFLAWHREHVFIRSSASASDRVAPVTGGRAGVVPSSSKITFP
ncbi:HNH endonuclease [uncultured Lamprocystis sp.]|nr:HNH endonuclease [uncultured Lamprocystis sp.]